MSVRSNVAIINVDQMARMNDPKDLFHPNDPNYPNDQMTQVTTVTVTDDRKLPYD